MKEGYIDKGFVRKGISIRKSRKVPKGISLRTLTAKGYDDKGPKRPGRGSAGGAHFAGQLANPCIYDMSTTTTTTTTTTITLIRPSPHKYEAQHAGICHCHAVIVVGGCLLACLLTCLLFC